MPELPEVETIARALRRGRNGRPTLVGMAIEAVELHWPRHVAEPSPEAFRQGLEGQRIQGVSRRGKFLVLPLEQGTLLVHLRMTGDLSMVSAEQERGPYDHTVFRLEDNWELRFSDARKFGKVYWVQDPETIFADLGPEPLREDFTPAVLQQRLERRSRAIKPLLLEQSFIAGVGNIYADEALHRAGLHPLLPADRLGPDDIEALWKAIRQSLQAGIDDQGTSLDWVYQGGQYQEQVRVYGQEGEPCPVCGTPIQRIVVSQRGTHFCPTCQPERAAQ